MTSFLDWLAYEFVTFNLMLAHIFIGDVDWATHRQRRPGAKRAETVYAFDKPLRPTARSRSGEQCSTFSPDGSQGRRDAVQRLERDASEARINGCDDGARALDRIARAIKGSREL
jgi:hypothetical protein